MGLFPALLKHWRARRGLSQLDLALEANVSARHISFLETGRAQPSDDMVLRLASALGVPLRDQDEMLAAAGFSARFAAPQPIEGAVLAIIERMMEKHEPYPMVVMNRAYDVVRMNHGAARLLPRLIADPSVVTPQMNACKLLFDPKLARPYVEGWEATAKMLLTRVHREALGGDASLGVLIRELLAYPDVPQDWQHPDLSVPSQAVMPFHLKTPEIEVRLVTTVTAFNAPQNVTLDELRIESYFPLDEATAAVLR